MPNFAQQMGGTQGADGTWALSSEQQSIITSLLSAGTFFGALLQSAFFVCVVPHRDLPVVRADLVTIQAFTSDRLGRRGSIMFWSAIFTVGIVIQTSSFSIGQLSAG